LMRWAKFRASSNKRDDAACWHRAQNSASVPTMMNKAGHTITERQVITSAANADVKLLRSLHERKFRKQTGWFLAEGLRICTEALAQDFAPQRLVFAEGHEQDSLIAPLIAACKKQGGRVLCVKPALLERISRKDNPQMVIGAFDQKWSDIAEVTPQQDACWIALDRVRDPGNLGTIMRTADAVGAVGVILIDDCTDPFSLEAVRASMGAVFNVKIVKVTTAAFTSFASHWPAQIIGTALPASKDYRMAAWQRPSILLMGNEQSGLTDELIDVATDVIRLPMRGQSDSLNLAVATGICLYEMYRDCPE
jgi:TrmH family RNA methyltransferase